MKERVQILENIIKTHMEEAHFSCEQCDYIGNLDKKLRKYNRKKTIDNRKKTC